MAKKYTVPAALINDFLAIKTKLGREFSINFLSGNSPSVSYKLACKTLKKKPSKTPRDSAWKIQTNSNVMRFISKAEGVLSLKALDGLSYTYLQRLEITQKVIELGLEQMATGKKTNGADILRAIEIQNYMLNGFERFKGMSPEEVYELEQSVIEGET